MDFNPIIHPENNENDNNKTDIVQSKVIEDPLSINNLVQTTKTHIIEDERCRLEIEIITKELNTLIDKMSVKELIEYYKVKLKEREFHNDNIYKAFNFALKTEYAKHLLLGKKDESKIINIIDKGRIVQLANLLKQHGN